MTSPDAGVGPHPVGAARAAEFGEGIRDHLARVESANAETLERVAERLLAVVRDDGLIYAAGTGHSVALVLETFYRAGGLACVYPLYHPGLLPLEGGGASTVIERTPGFAATMLAGVRPSDRDLAVVFSSSGVNPVPVELAEALRGAGTPVVAVCSVAHMRSAPQRAGRTLGDVATEILDTMTPPGDAAFDVDGVRTAPLSSLTSAYLWDLLLARLVERAGGEGVPVPLWTSANVAGGDERNRELAARYRDRIPPL